jgi:hypothetical protein
MSTWPDISSWYLVVFVDGFALTTRWTWLVNASLWVSRFIEMNEPERKKAGIDLTAHAYMLESNALDHRLLWSWPIVTEMAKFVTSVGAAPDHRTDQRQRTYALIPLRPDKQSPRGRGGQAGNTAMTCVSGPRWRM